MKLETSLLAEFYFKLGLLAYGREQYTLANEYFQLSNEVLK